VRPCGRLAVQLVVRQAQVDEGAALVGRPTCGVCVCVCVCVCAKGERIR